MINLLSIEHKSAIRAARVNVILSRYMGIVAIAIVFLMAVLYVSYTVLEQTMATAENRIAANATKAEVYSTTKQQINALSSQLTDANVLLEQGHSYSTVLTTLGKTMPAGTIIQSLKLDETVLTNGKPVELIAYAKTEESAALIQQQLQTSPIFTQVSLVGTDTSAGIAEYPVKVTISVVFNGKGV